MNKFLVLKHPPLTGEVFLPGDKSISHRSVIISAISESEVTIKNFLQSDDCLRTVECFKSMGIKIDNDGETLTVFGKGLKGLKHQKDILFVGNSGTTIRLLMGILAGQPFKTIISGDDSIKRRPMDRVVRPLNLMGAKLVGRDVKQFAPIIIEGGELKPIEYELPVASAQVKSAILLAGLYANGLTTVIEKIPTRDHTERMLRYFNAEIVNDGNKISIKGGQRLTATTIDIPSDISSAAYLMVAAVLIPGSDLIIKNVGINPGRTGIIEVLKDMGADIELLSERNLCEEPVADIRVKHSFLKGIEISGAIIPRIIDEIPIIALAATQAEGQTIIKDAKELRVKESDRISTTTKELNRLGAGIKEISDGMKIPGNSRLKQGVCRSYGDHRVAMTCAVAGLIINGKTEIQNINCVDTSFPGFSEIFGKDFIKVV